VNCDEFVLFALAVVGVIDRYLRILARLQELVTKREEERNKAALAAARQKVADPMSETS
jgi:hypothetical protein